MQSVAYSVVLVLGASNDESTAAHTNQAWHAHTALTSVTLGKSHCNPWNASSQHANKPVHMPSTLLLQVVICQVDNLLHILRWQPMTFNYSA